MLRLRMSPTLTHFDVFLSYHCLEKGSWAATYVQDFLQVHVSLLYVSHLIGYRVLVTYDRAAAS